LSLPSPGPRFVFTPSLTRIRGWIPQPGGRKKVRLFHIFSFELFVEGETVITRLAEEIRIIVSAATGKWLSKRDYKR
jgi:hypothetical protein